MQVLHWIVQTAFSHSQKCTLAQQPGPQPLLQPLPFWHPQAFSQDAQLLQQAGFAQQSPLKAWVEIATLSSAAASNVPVLIA
jgi:hypothetical protein